MGAFGWDWLADLPQRLQALERQPRTAYPHPGMPRPVGSGTNHAAVNLLPGHGACMSTKEHGTLAQEMATTAECSSPLLRGSRSEEWFDQTELRRRSRFTDPGSSGSVTGDRGGSGAPPERADYIEEDS